MRLSASATSGKQQSQIPFQEEEYMGAIKMVKAEGRSEESAVEISAQNALPCLLSLCCEMGVSSEFSE